VNLAVHFIRARSLNCSSGPFLFILYFEVNEKKEENCGWEGRGGRWEKSISLPGKWFFLYFIYVVAIISI